MSLRLGEIENKEPYLAQPRPLLECITALTAGTATGIGQSLPAPRGMGVFHFHPGRRADLSAIVGNTGRNARKALNSNWEFLRREGLRNPGSGWAGRPIAGLANPYQEVGQSAAGPTY